MHINYLHDEGNPTSVLYIQISRNKITVRDLENKREVPGDVTFSNQRLLTANFFAIEKVLHGLVLQLHPHSTWHSSLPAKRMDIVVSALGMNEGGLSQVEERILHEVVARTALMKHRQFHTHAQPVVFGDSVIIAMLKQKQSYHHWRI